MLSSPLLQDDFSSGMWRIAPHLIPASGAYRLENFLLDEDGSAYARRGTSMKSNAAFGATGLRMVWDGYLAGGQRTVFANAADFGVLAADDETPVNVGGPGLAGPVKPVAIDGLLFAGVSVYGGSRKTASYATGTVAATVGSTTVVGSGTSWVAPVDAGMVLTLGGRVFAVKSVTDNTHLELWRPFTGTSVSGQSYSLDPVAAVPASYNPGGTWAVAGQRLISLLNDRIAMSHEFDSSTWDGTDEWLLPEGSSLLGGASIGDQLLAFTTAGVWGLGNLAYDLTDATGNVQQSLHQMNQDLVLWDQAGLATWESALVAPCVNGIWLLSSSSQKLLSASITPLIAKYVGMGYRLGQATVHRSCYLLPILDSGGSPVDLLVCRLDRPTQVRGFGEVWPWTNWAGAGAQVAALDVRVLRAASRQPLLLGADRTAGSRVISYAPFEPDGKGTDHDGTVPAWEFVSRSIPTGGKIQNLNMVKWLRARYELIAPTTVAMVQAAAGSEAKPAMVTWGNFVWGDGSKWQDQEGLGFASLSPDGPEADGDRLVKWKVTRNLRFFKAKLASDDECQRFVLRAFEMTVRPSGRM